MKSLMFTIFSIAKKSYLTSILAFVFIIACASPGSLRKPYISTESVMELRKKIDQILEDSSLSQTRTGIKIVSLKTSETFYSQNSHQLFHPGSNMKLLTTATALKQLGLNFKFKTVLYTDTASISDSTISGNLYLKGYGNPDLTTDNLRWMVQKLKRCGITHITGDLIYDDTYMDELYYGAGWMWDDASSSDFAPISALTVNDNCITVTVKPGTKIGDRLIVQLEPQTSYMKIENAGFTIDSLDTLQRKAFRVERKWKVPENTIVIKGGRVICDMEKSFKIDVLEAGFYTATLLWEILKREEIMLDGEVHKGAIPDTNVIMVEHLSPPLSLVVFNTDKESDNLSAELILKTLGAEKKGIPGTAEKGITVIYQFLNEIGLDSSTYKLADGSGVSRYNLISPNLIIELLKAMHKDFTIQAEFKTSLPIAGVDGTLENRMKNSSATKRLRAKTGTLNGVSSLAGYTTTEDGEILAFSIMMEHFVIPVSKIRKVQDQIGNLISSFSRNSIVSQ